MKKIISILILLIVFSSTALFAKEFKIGVAVALTGKFGKAGNLVKDAYTFWQEQVNKNGGINVKGKKFPVKLIFYDDKSEPSTGAKMIERLIIHDKVDLLLGGFGSSQVFAESAVSEKYGFPLISGAASSNKLFERGFKYYFSTLGKATEEVKGCVYAFSALKNKPKTAAVIGADILFTSLACEGFKKYCKEKGIKIIHYELFPMRLQDYNSLLLKIKQKNPDVLFVGSHLLVAMRVIKALKEINFSPKGVAFSYGPTVPKFVEDLKGDAEYVVAASEWTPNLPYKGSVLGRAKDFAKGYLKRFGRMPDYVEAASAAGAVALQKAVETLGIAPDITDKEREKIAHWLHNNEVNTFYGKIKFNKNGANISHPALAVQIQKGNIKTIYPANVKDADLIYPFKEWKKR